MKIFKSPAVLLVVLLMSVSAMAKPTFYLVRHAEKEVSKTKNPKLTEQGEQRARFVAQMLSQVGIKKVYSTDYIRTLETAKPTADLLALEIEKYDPRKLAEFTKLLIERNESALIVGHSNTTPQLVSLLSGKPTQSLDESNYDNLYQVNFVGEKPQVTLLKTWPSQLAVQKDSLQLDSKKITSQINNYQMSYQGKPVGNTVHKIIVNKKQILLEEVTQLESFKVDAKIAIDFDMTKQNAETMTMTGTMGKTVDINLTWTKAGVKGHSEMARAINEPQGKIEINNVKALEVVERTSMIMLAAFWDLPKEKAVNVDWYNAYNNDTRAIQIKHLGTATVQTPAGEFATDKVEFLGGAPSQIFYISREAQPKVVKIEVIGSPWQYHLLSSQKL